MHDQSRVSWGELQDFLAVARVGKLNVNPALPEAAEPILRKTLVRR